MKRYFLTVVFLCTAFVAYADKVSESIARQTASLFFYGNTSSSQSLARVDPSESVSVIAEQKDAPFYIYNRKSGGFVIISGDNCLRPVLAYSDEKTFTIEDMPENVRWWLESITGDVLAVRSGNAIPSSSVAAQWASVGLRTKASSEYCLGTPEWNQKAPFNTKCPVVSGQNCVAGCVPIAITEVMAYHSWPEKASGTISGYTDSYDIVHVERELGYVYGISDIHNIKTTSQASGATQTVKDGLAQLIIDVGESVKASYSLSGTSAAVDNLISSICNNFSFNRGAKLLNRDVYEDASWFEMLKSSVAAKKPVIYSGQETGGGHAFVIDGYDSDGNVHINFGWGGNNNGYYWIGTNFYGDQEAIFDFVPDKDGSSSYYQGPITLGRYGESFTLLLGDLSSKVGFSMMVSFVNYAGAVSHTHHFKLVHLNKNDEYVEDVSLEKDLTFDEPGGKSLTFVACHCSSEVKFGDKIALYESSDKIKWKLIDHSLDGSSTWCYNATPYSFLDIPATCSVGDRICLKLKNYNYTYVWSWYGTAYNTCNVVEWKIYKDGKLYKNLNSYDVRFFDIPSAGTWTVVACVSNYTTGAPYQVVSTSVTAR